MTHRLGKAAEVGDYIGRLVNTIGDGAYAFSTHLREFFLMGVEKGSQAIRNVVKKAWARVTN